MFHLTRREGVSEYSALIDIGSGTIGVGIVAWDTAKKAPQFLYMDRVMLRLGEGDSSSGVQNVRRVSEALLSASLNLSQEGMRALHEKDPHAKLSQTHVVCSSPWSHTIINYINHTGDEEVPITASLLRDLSHNTEEGVFARFKDVTGNNPAEFDIIERTFLNLRVNDYEIPLGSSVVGKTVSATETVSFVSKELLHAIHDMHDKLFPHTNLLIHSTLLSVLRTVQDFFTQTASITLINVTGESSEVALIDEGILTQIHIVPYGSNTFVRDVMQGSGRPESDIITNLRAYGETSAVVPMDFEQYTDTYRSLITDLFSKILEKNIIPVHFVITTHKPFRALFGSIIGEAYDELCKKKVIELTLHEDTLHEIAGAGEGDIYLSLAARFFHTEKQRGQVMRAD